MKKIILLVILLLITTIAYFTLTKQAPKSPTNPNLTKVTKEEITVVAAGDIACDFESKREDQCQQEKTARLIENINPDLVLALGDLQYDRGGIEEFQNFYHPSWGKFKDITKPAIGNHEYQTRGGLGYFTYFNHIPSYYSFDVGNWHMISLNSNCSSTPCHKNSQQLMWLKEDLSRKNKKCTLAFLHHPFVSIGPHGSLDALKDIWQALYDKQVEVVLSGHDHNYQRWSPINATRKEDPVGVTQFIVGTGGRSLYKFTNPSTLVKASTDQSFGVLKLTLKQGSLEWEFIPTKKGGFSDQGTLLCN